MSNALATAVRKNIHCTVSFAPMEMTQERQNSVSTLANTMRRVSEDALSKATEFTGVAVAPQNKIVAQACVDYVIWETMKVVASETTAKVFQRILNVHIKYDAFEGEKFLETVSLNFNPNGAIVVAENEGEM